MIERTYPPSRAIILVNLGTPDAPTPEAVRRYLKEFLWDKRVVDVPRIVWWCILNGIVLQTRPARSALAYHAIWTPDGSPLRALTERLTLAVQKEFHMRGDHAIRVEYAMRYGRPSLRDRFSALRAEGYQQLSVFPLYPQYSAASTGSVFDAVASTLSEYKHVPDIRVYSDYHCHPSYIHAIAEHINQFWEENGSSDYLLMSFHGLPEKSREQGDPYYDQCHTTARFIAERLQLPENAYQVVFQSRFGAARWLSPDCLEVLKQLPVKGIRRVDIVCPGFAVDCLETLEEIGITNKKAFLEAGGEHYRLISALNDTPQHASALADIILST